ncbi:hypothetical protein IAG44_40385 [Streptomyces roseirectus]|uniref:Uncharacterized protein n=1 Tax=Streptomyces roseirectus TaxID=2768066 RepID=A0A7H0IQJ2_9ACTN|nr:hypothetical protein IAG44_40385 [Streptomyces roseirectus]
MTLVGDEVQHVLLGQPVGVVAACRWLRERGSCHWIVREGIECSQRLGGHRWVVEGTVSWLAGCTAAVSARPSTSWPSSVSPQP